MELQLMAQALLRRWYLVLIPVMVVVVISLPLLLPGNPTAAGGYTTVIRYTAAQVLSAIPERDGDFQDVWLASELTVNAFTEWVRSGKFAAEVNAALATDGLAVDTTGRYAADNERSIGQLFISWGDAAELEQIAAAAIAVLQNRSSDYFPQLGSVPAQVTLLDTPTITAAPPPLTNRLRPLLQIGLALVAGIGLALLVEYLDPALRRRQQVEALGLAVIAAVPGE
ncbi:MAG: hypothetical protein H7Y11_14755 [Armatimonadetes bacterium]|nr:hypothetical protein [Anaerolineae bacterium]